MLLELPTHILSPGVGQETHRWMVNPSYIENFEYLRFYKIKSHTFDQPSYKSYEDSLLWYSIGFGL